MYRERNKKQFPMPRIGWGKRMLSWGKADVPSAQKRTLVIKTIPPLYLEVFEHARYENYDAHKYLLVFR